jgi:hypothetical protein
MLISLGQLIVSDKTCPAWYIIGTLKRNQMRTISLEIAHSDMSSYVTWKSIDIWTVVRNETAWTDGKETYSGGVGSSTDLPQLLEVRKGTLHEWRNTD